MALPPHSPGVLAAALGDRTVLYDLVTEVVHVLNPTAGLVWEACDGESRQDAVVAELAAVAGADTARVATDVTTCVRQLADAGLVGRTTRPSEPPPVERPAVEGASVSSIHAVLDEGVRFRSDDTGLLAAVDELLGATGDEPAATVDLGVREDDDGTVRLRGWVGGERAFPSRQAFLWALPTALNQIAAATATCLSLHAGAVRSPAGEVLLLPATSGSGKTTFTAALVQAGWDYATDEAVGLRAGSLMAVAYPKPLVLDARSRAVLGLAPTESPNTAPTELRADVQILRGNIGPVTRVVLPRYEAGTAASLVALAPDEAIVAVLEHALNLPRVGQPGLEALCALARTVPVHRLVHGGINAAAASQLLDVR